MILNKIVIATIVYWKTRKNGGATVSITGKTPKTEYVYAPSKGTETVVSPAKLSIQFIISFMNQYWSPLQVNGNYIGTWTEEGDFCFDVVTVGSPSPKTIAKAQNARQLAVFDLSQKADIRIGEMTETGYVKLGDPTDIYNEYCLRIEKSKHTVQPATPDVFTSWNIKRYFAGVSERVFAILSFNR